MSSTNRSDARKSHIADYYVTPISEIEKFIDSINQIDFNIFRGNILDPCAGGDELHPMSYPAAIHNKVKDGFELDTIDIRQDSCAEVKADYLIADCKDKYDLIITNPPFGISLDIIKKALDDVREYGHVVMLQRLNFMGSKERSRFWLGNIPKYIFVHQKRMRFTDTGSTDSIEYAHYVWQKGWNRKYSMVYFVPYDKDYQTVA